MMSEEPPRQSITQTPHAAEKPVPGCARRGERDGDKESGARAAGCSALNSHEDVRGPKDETGDTNTQMGNSEGETGRPEK